jgi:uncharacterized protein (TIGR03067 family)
VLGQTLLLLTCGLFVGSNDEAVQDFAQLEGVWRFALVQVDGKKQPEVPFATNKMIIGKDGSYIVIQGPRVTRGSIRLNPASAPKQYDVTITTGLLKGRTFPGIYELEKDRWRICLPLGGKDRPAALASNPGSGLMLQILERERQTVKEASIEASRLELSGTWQAESYALDGKKASADDLKKIKLVIDAHGKSEAFRDGQVFIASTTKLDPTQNPMTIDVTFTEGDSKGKTALGIYRIEGDLLTICRSAPDQARPTMFASTPGSGHTLMTYKREKQETR